MSAVLRMLQILPRAHLKSALCAMSATVSMMGSACAIATVVADTVAISIRKARASAVSPVVAHAVAIDIHEVATALAKRAVVADTIAVLVDETRAGGLPYARANLLSGLARLRCERASDLVPAQHAVPAPRRSIALRGDRHRRHGERCDERGARRHHREFLALHHRFSSPLFFAYIYNTFERSVSFQLFWKISPLGETSFRKQ